MGGFNYARWMERSAGHGFRAQTRFGQIQDHLRAQILRGEYGPGTPLKPQKLATSLGVSLSVVREALQQLIGEGLAERNPNRGFTVPEVSDLRWQQIAEGRRTLEPNMLVKAIERGDLEWETQIRAAHHRLDRTPLWVEDAGSPPRISEDWSAAHYEFHRALLNGCDNLVLLETFDRMWTLSELARRWSSYVSTVRDHGSDHRRLEELVLARDRDAAATLLDQHIALTAEALSVGQEPAAQASA